METLTPKTIQLIDKYFSVSEQDTVKSLLIEECRDFSERIHFAIIKLSNGDADTLLQMIHEAKIDYRDVLVWADFAHDVDEHIIWANTVLHLPNRRI